MANGSKHFVAMTLSVFYVLDTAIVSQKLSQGGFALHISFAA
jgi:hypothetical protein